MFNTLLLLYVRLLHLFLFVVPQPDFWGNSCFDNNGNYTEGSTYESNLKDLFSKISSDTQIDYGFYNFSVGKEPDQVNGIGLCRGDVGTANCQICLRNASHKLTDVCPNRKKALGWYDNCMFRYSNGSIFGVWENITPSYICNRNSTTMDPDQFSKTLGTLLREIQNRTAYGDSRRKYAIGESSLDAFVTLYALSQCTPDLSEMDCYNCLEKSINSVPGLCSTSLGARVFEPSCILRYEIYKLAEPAVSISPRSGKTGMPTDQHLKGSQSTHIIIATAFSAAAFSAALLILASTLIICCLKCRSQRLTLVNNRLNTGEEVTTIGSLQFDFSTVATATDNFSEANKLGHGGFGTVYKGRLSNGTEIAVNRLATSSTQGRNEFKNEVSLLAKLQHRNLVRLHGFCLEEEERLLVYEFVPNKSLDYFLFDASKQANLSWEMRYKIILGIARGLLYLHEDSRLTIIHRDLKASNILLDSEMNPKISDFGIARLFNVEQTHADTSKVAGTYGYMAPEYALYGTISVKADVYSF